MMAATDDLRTLAGELRRVYEHNTDWLRDEAVTLAASVDAMREAADTIESMRDRLQPVPAELDYIEDKSRWFQLFGTPERAVRTIQDKMLAYDLLTQCDDCPYQTDECFKPSCKCAMQDYDVLLEWLRGDA